MKYRKNEAKEYAKKTLHGVWTALPTIFTKDDKLDEPGNAANLEHCISRLNLAGHYCIGNVGEFWFFSEESYASVARNLSWLTFLLGALGAIVGLIALAVRRARLTAHYAPVA